MATQVGRVSSITYNDGTVVMWEERRALLRAPLHQADAP